MFVNIVQEQLISEGFKPEQLNEDYYGDNDALNSIKDKVFKGKLNRSQAEQLLKTKVHSGEEWRKKQLDKIFAEKKDYDEDQRLKREWEARQKARFAGNGNTIKPARFKKTKGKGNLATAFVDQWNKTIKTPKTYYAGSDLDESFDDELNLIVEEVLLEGTFDRKIKKISDQLIRLRYRAKKALKKGKITEKEYDKVKAICDRADNQLILYSGKNFHGYQKSMVKQQINKLHTEIKQLANDSTLIEILKKAGVFTLFFGIITGIFYTSLGPWALAAGGAGGLAGLGLKKLVDAIKGFAMVNSLKFDNFKGNMDNSIDDFKQEFDFKDYKKVKSDDIATTSLKESYFNY